MPSVGGEKASLPGMEARQPVAEPRGLYDSSMNLDVALSLRTNIAVEMTVFATVSSFARLACLGQRAAWLTIEWE